MSSINIIRNLMKSYKKTPQEIGKVKRNRNDLNCTKKYRIFRGKRQTRGLKLGLNLAVTENFGKTNLEDNFHVVTRLLKDSGDIPDIEKIFRIKPSFASKHKLL